MIATSSPRTSQGIEEVDEADLEAKLAHRYKGTLRLTKLAESMLDDPRRILSQMLFALCTTFNMGYFDRMDEQPYVTTAGAFTYLTVARYGSEQRGADFYAGELLKFRPDWVSYNTRSQSNIHNLLYPFPKCAS